MTALTFKDRKLVLVEYPAIVKNTDRMMKSLGGIEEISKTYADPTRRLEMKFRPEDPYCKSAYGNNTDVSCLVLKVKKNRGNTDEPYTVTIEGTISTAYKFRGMVDFQYLPMRRKADGTGYESLLDQLIPPPMSSTDWLMKDAPVFILPQVFSRLDTMSIQALRDEPKRRELASGPPFRPRNAMIGRTRDRRVKFACFLNFDEEEVPTEPNPEAWKQLEWRPPDVNIKQRVQALFQQRPLWTRSALQVELNVLPVRFKLILPVVAYYVVNGPFRTAWVRLGFDPRKDPSTKIYQILDFRLKTSPCAMMLNEVSTKRGSSAYLVPTKMFYHLKDICMASVQKLVHANDGREAATCHERDGWCEEGTMNKCRQLMMAELKATVDKIRSEQPSTSREESPVALEEDDEFDDFSDDEGDED
ncbi:hypothetical protein MRX96_047816 [Rhipicephalus microplus]